MIEQIPANWPICAIGANKTPFHPDGLNWAKNPLTTEQLRRVERRAKALALLTGEFSGILAVDCDGQSAEALITEIAGMPLHQALPKTVSVTSGKIGHWQAFYSVPQEFHPYLRSRVIAAKTKGEQLEFRWNGKCSIFTGEHPETGSYRWVNPPSEVAIAPIPYWALRECLNFESAAKPNRREWGDRDWALSYLNSVKNVDLDWHDYSTVLFALHHAGVEREIALVWSKSSEKHTDKGFNQVWNYIKNDKNRNITVATLGAIAKEHGWRGSQNRISVIPTLEDDLRDSVLNLLSEESTDFPITEILPAEIAKPLAAKAKSLNCPQGAIAAIFLAVCASLLPTETRLFLGGDFFVPPILWFSLVGVSGSAKSPLMNSVTKPLKPLELAAFEQFKQQQEAYETALQKWENTPKKDRGKKPKPPAKRFYRITDFTTEAVTLVQSRQENNGILIAVDELVGFFNGLNQYKRGNGSDRQKWLEFYNGDGGAIVRVTREDLFLKNSSFSIIGGIQPSVLKRTLGDFDEIDGLFARFSFLKIPNRKLPPISSELINFSAIENLYKSLSERTAATIPVTKEALEAWNNWQDFCEEKRLKEPCEGIAAIYPKAKDRVARIALVLAAIHGVSVIDENLMERAIQFGYWLLRENLKVYQELGIAENAEASQIARFIDRFKDSGWVTPREVSRWNARQFKTAKEARSFLEKIVALGFAVSRPKPFSIKIQLPKPDGGDGDGGGDSPEPSPPEIEQTEPTQDLPDNQESHTSNRGNAMPPLVAIPELNADWQTVSEQLSFTPETVEVRGDKLAIAGKEGTLLIQVEKNPQETYQRLIEGFNKTKTVQNPREAVQVTDGKIEVNLQQLDLFSEPAEIPEWGDELQIKPYGELRKLYLDIETSGLNPDSDRVLMVGLSDGKSTTILTEQDEAQLLGKFLEQIQSKPEVLIGHNLFNFDLPFLAKRCEIHGLRHPFKIAEKVKTITSASLNGEPIKFYPVYWRGVEIIDTFHQIAIWDKSAAKLKSYGLKDSVIALGLRTERRLELSNSQITEMWECGDLATIQQYLEHDLKDTQLLADYLLPVVWYQKRYVPLSFQEIAVASPAKKAQAIHEMLYPQVCPQADKKLEYEGGTCKLFAAGIHRNVAKIDVASLYPSVMLRYGICSQKDPHKLFLGVLKRLTELRLELKARAKEGDRDAAFQEKALKVLINGSYGFLGTAAYGFNDFIAASLVTAYGRKILDLMMGVVAENGGTLIEVDTDGIFFSHQNPEAVLEAVQNALPSGIKVELETRDAILFAPKAKSYILLEADGKTTIKGVFRKRDRYALETEFTLEFLKRLALEGAEAAIAYYEGVCRKLKRREIAVEQLAITRKIRKGEKALLALGKEGDKVTYWIGCNGVTNTKPYNPDYYLEDLAERVSVFSDYLGHHHRTDGQLSLIA
ncbi:DUF3987 domain-containing protein [Thermosynechococcus sp. FA-CM-4201]